MKVKKTKQHLLGDVQQWNHKGGAEMTTLVMDGIAMRLGMGLSSHFDHQQQCCMSILQQRALPGEPRPMNLIQDKAEFVL